MTGPSRAAAPLDGDGGERPSEAAPRRPAPGGSLRAAVEGAVAVLAEAGVPSPRADALALAAHALGVETLVLAVAPPVPADFVARFAELVDRRRRREPLQHLVGRMAFRHLDLPAGPGVFVVRPETEVVAQVAVDEAARLAADAEPVVVDLCTGSGAIALAVATEVPAARVHAVDVSALAIAAARRSAAALDAALGHPLDLREGDVRTAFHDLDGAVDVVVANPPYIPPDAVPTDPEVRDHDPDVALYGGGADGLEVPRAVVVAAARLLRPGGLLVMEHAEVQADAVREVVAATGAFERPRTLADLTGRDRMVVARRAPTTGLPPTSAGP